MTFSSKLESILQAELLAGNTVKGEYRDQFGNCRLLVVLQLPFCQDYSASFNVQKFENRDAHYPVGRGYKDLSSEEILLAPCS
jgi:hypothetical protein